MNNNKPYKYTWNITIHADSYIGAREALWSCIEGYTDKSDPIGGSRPCYTEERMEYSVKKIQNNEQ